MGTAAHLQQLERVAVIGHQGLEGGVVHGRVVHLYGRQRLGVHKHHGQRRDKVRLWRERGRERGERREEERQRGGREESEWGSERGRERREERERKAKWHPVVNPEHSSIPQANREEM